jgi:hypothetical protein
VLELKRQLAEGSGSEVGSVAGEELSAISEEENELGNES